MGPAGTLCGYMGNTCKGTARALLPETLETLNPDSTVYRV